MTKIFLSSLGQKFRRISLFLSLLTAGNFASSADSSNFDISLEELLNIRISVASKRPEDVRKAPSVVTVMTREEIESFGAQNLIELIDRLPGTQITGNVGFYGNRVQVRGQPASSQDRHTLILLNGRPIRENINGGNNAYLYHGFPITAIDHLEVIRGPGSVLYGTNAYATVINIITRRTEWKEGEFKGTYGSQDTQTGNFVYMAKAKNNIDYLIAARRSLSEGPNIEHTDALGTTDSLEYQDDSDAVFFNANTERFNLQAAYHTYSPGEFGLLGRHLTDVYVKEANSFFADAGLTFRQDENTSFHLNTTLSTFSWESVDGTGVQYERRNSTNFIIEPMLKLKRLDSRFNLVFGGTAEFDRYNGADLNADDHFIHSIYSQGDYTFTDSLKMVLGLQYNKPEDIKSNLSPRVGFVWTGPKNWGAKLLYSEAFRRAFATEINLNNPFLIGNQDLKPEEIRTYEAQINYQNRKFQGDLAYYYSHQTNVIEVDTGAPLQFINHSGYVVSDGLELTGRYLINPTWSFQGSGSWLNGKNKTTLNNISTDGPDYLVKGGIRGHMKTLTFGLFNTYFASNKNGDTFNNLQSNLTWNASEFLKVMGDRVEVALYGNNLLNKKTMRNGKPAPDHHGRRIYLNLTMKW